MRGGIEGVTCTLRLERLDAWWLFFASSRALGEWCTLNGEFSPQFREGEEVFKNGGSFTDDWFRIGKILIPKDGESGREKLEIWILRVQVYMLIYSRIFPTICRSANGGLVQVLINTLVLAYIFQILNFQPLSRKLAVARERFQFFANL